MSLRAMAEAHGPGWTFELELEPGVELVAQIWAPREATDTRRARTGWISSFDVLEDDGVDWSGAELARTVRSDFVDGLGSLEEALELFAPWPAAVEALRSAATSDDPATPDNGRKHR